MRTIAEQLELILNTKEEIRSAILEHEVIIPSDTPFALYPDKIRQIEVNRPIVILPNGQLVEIFGEVVLDIIILDSETTTTELALSPVNIDAATEVLPLNLSFIDLEIIEGA